MDPVAQVFERELFGVKLGLDNIRTITAVLGHPERAYRTVIVAGTNGKGSVAAMTAAALQAAGIRTGRYTSPHLTRIEERFAIDGTPVDRTVLERAAAAVLAAEARALAAAQLPGPATFFELTTAVAFEIFRLMRVEIAVLEVGLGGRFDATNVVMPMAGAITTIDLDHTAQLGTTLPAIAFEKAGIMKPGMTVVTGEEKPEALEVLRRHALDIGATLVEAGRDTTVSEVVMETDGAMRANVSTSRADYGNVRLSLRGRHQVRNALVAVRLLESLSDHGVALPAAAIRTGLTAAEWPGRLQLVPMAEDRAVLLDAAHNEAGARALTAYLAEWQPGGVPIVFAAMRDKDVDAMLSALAPVARAFVMTVPDNRRALAPDVLAGVAARVAPGVRVLIEPRPMHAIARAFDGAPVVCVAGSIFLVGEVLPQLTGGDTGRPA